MPSWKTNEKRLDRNGSEIGPGDILQAIDETDATGAPMRYICFLRDTENVEVRDLCNNNVCTCEVRDEKDPPEYASVISIGHYSQHPGVLNQDDIDYYFGEVRPPVNYKEFKAAWDAAWPLIRQTFERIPPVPRTEQNALLNAMKRRGAVGRLDGGICIEKAKK